MKKPKIQKIDLMSLSPKEATLTLDGKTVTLCRFSLRVRTWALEKYGGPKGFQDIFEGKKMAAIAELGFYMLKEKDVFPTQDDFFDAINTTKDQIDLIKALLTSIGIGEPEIKKLDDQLAAELKEKIDPNVQSPNP